MAKKFDLNKYKEKIKAWSISPVIGVVYLIRNKLNDKMYVGQTRQKFKTRFQQHCYGGNSNSILSKAIKKYGADQFEYCILMKCRTQQDMDRYEKECIRILNTIDPGGYNLRLDNKETARQTKDKISKSRKGKIPWNKGLKTGVTCPHKGYTINGNKYLARHIETGVEVCFITSNIPGFNSGHIIQCCKGNLKQHKGYKWEYIENGKN